MRYLITTLFYLILIIPAFSQKWTYQKGGNSFDGEYKTSSIVGSGGEFPYTKPLFVVNHFEKSKDLNIYFTNAGYSGCDNLQIRIKFSGDPNVYFFNSFPNKDRDSWFITFNRYSLDEFELLKKLKEFSSFEARLESDCGIMDFKFSLSGSSAAIDFVSSDWIKIKEIEKIEKARKEQELAEREKIEEQERLERKKKEELELAEKNRIELEKKVKQDSIDRVKKMESIEHIKKLIISGIGKKYQGENFKIVSLKGDGIVLEGISSNLSIPVFQTREDDLAIIDISKKVKSYFRLVYYHGKGEVDYFIEDSDVKSYEN